jgi:hypothetical protein
MRIRVSSEERSAEASLKPVTLHYLSPLEAEQLVGLFHQHLNPMIALLDPDCRLHSHLS